MKAPQFVTKASAIALVSAFAGCATWHDMDRSERGTAAGATGGAIAGAVVGGPIGAAVGAGIGGYAGHYETQPGGIATNVPESSGGNAAAANVNAAARRDMNGNPGDDDRMLASETGTVRSVQQALNERGFNAGQVDGQWGPNTEDALRQFQQSKGLAPTGNLDQRTLDALNIAR